MAAKYIRSRAANFAVVSVSAFLCGLLWARSGPTPSFLQPSQLAPVARSTLCHRLREHVGAPVRRTAGSAGAGGSNELRIPRILHRVFLSGRDAFEELRSKNNSGIRPEWDDYCRLLHTQAGWQYHFWDEAAALQLIEQHYPFFLPTWRSMKRVVSRGDAIRYFILHKFGGVYLDLDVQCYRPGEDLLRGFDVVLQGEVGSPLINLGYAHDLTNAAMASVPGHMIWSETFKVLRNRADAANDSNPIYSTGPRVVRTAFDRLVPLPKPPPLRPQQLVWDSEPRVGTHRLGDGTVIRVYPLGEWYSPCLKWHDVRCFDRLQERTLRGIISPKLAGYHRFSGTWTPKAKETNDPAVQGAS